MEKAGRSRSKDPRQEDLRTHKDEWNSETSKLIGKLISFKRGLNGKGDKSSGLPAGSIKEPIPTPVASYLDEIIHSSNLVIDHARAIINEQKEYAQGYEHTHTHTHASIKEQELIRLANLLGEASLSVEASWWGSRLYSKIKFLFTEPELREKKLSLMRALVALLSDLKDFEKILTSKKNSIGKIISIFNSFLFSFENSYINNFLIFSDISKEKLEDVLIEEPELEKEKLETKKIEKSEKIEPIKPSLVEDITISSIIDDIQFLELVLNLMIKDSNNASLKKDLDGFILLFNMVRVDESNPDLENETIKRYKELLEIANSYFKTTASSFQDIEIPENVLKKNASAVSNLLDRMSLTFQRGMVPFLKKEILKEITSLKKNISSTLDEIEKVESNYVSIDAENIKMIDSIKSIINKMIDLGSKFAQEMEVKSRDDKFHLTDFKMEHLNVLKQHLKKLENYEKISRNK